MPRVRRPFALLLGAALAVAACSASPDSAPSFVPSPHGPGVEGSNGVHIEPILPTPPLGPSGAGAPASPGASGSPGQGDPLVVATHLQAPVGVALLPDGSALVGERTTGRIVQVQPQPGQPVPTVRTLRGLDAGGDGGLLDLALSPTYVEDNLIYAYVTTRTDNRVVDFTLHGPVTPVLTGIPKGRTDNSGRLAFAADGTLYVGTGDAGRRALAASPRSLAGKVLRINAIGTPVGGPNPRSPVFSRGHRVVDGLCAVPGSRRVLDVEAGATGRPDVLNLIARGGYYGWPRTTLRQRAPLALLPAADGAPGGCAVLGSAVFVTSLDGHAVLRAEPRTAGGSLRVGAFAPLLRNRYGRLRTVVAAPDGALWLTTSNRDGHGQPVADDERVIRYVPDVVADGETT